MGFKAPDAPAPEPFEMWAERSEVACGLLGARVRKLMKQVKLAMVRVEHDDVEVTWAGVSMSRQEIVRGMRLAAVLARGPGKGPYR